jgi:hypothetical protein
MKLFVSILALVGLISCVKQEIKPQKPTMGEPIITNPTFDDTTVSLKNTTWVITKVLNTDMDEDFRSDTLVFTSNDVYNFNGVESTYYFYFSNVGFTLTLNNTAWGHISGSVVEYNLIQGSIENCQFKNYITGQNVVKVWMYKI